MIYIQNAWPFTAFNGVLFYYYNNSTVFFLRQIW